MKTHVPGERGGTEGLLSHNEYSRLVQALPILQHADPRLAREVQRVATFARIRAGRDVFVEGDHADQIALLLSGTVRVYKIGESGREITLYRFGFGESCVLTAGAILNRKTFPAIATVEQDAEAVMIPAEAFRAWVHRYDVWRDFVLDLLAQRLTTVMEIVDEVAFRRLDVRVAACARPRASSWPLSALCRYSRACSTSACSRRCSVIL